MAGGALKRPGWGLWLGWTLVLAVGAILDGELPAFWTFVIGAIPQWLLLRQYVPAASGWLLAAPVSGAIAALVAVGMAFGGFPGGTVPLFGGFILGAVIGTIVGTGQWLVLQRHVVNAGWWVGASALGWAAGVALAAAVSAGTDPHGMRLYHLAVGAGLTERHAAFLVSARRGAMMGPVVGATTGVALLWLLRQRRRT
jgi:hypothetical protein